MFARRIIALIAGGVLIGEQELNMVYVDQNSWMGLITGLLMITLHLIIFQSLYHFFFVKSLFDVLLQLLMCDRCQRGYHVECLGPFYPTEPEGDDDVWVSKI